MPRSDPFTFHLPKSLDIKVQNALYFFPDVLDYQFNRTQYHDEWAKLSQEKGGYLIVQSGQLDRVGWLRYTFERVKGWFGFSNECHPAKIKMAAQKLAYFGYLNEFNQRTVLDVISGWDHQFQPEKTYIDTCKKDRNNKDSSFLQEHLVAFYRKHAQQLCALNTIHLNLPLPQNNTGFKFGHTYAMCNQLVDMVHLDVQDEEMINAYLPFFEDGYSTLVGSTCRHLFIAMKLKTIQANFNDLSQKQSVGNSFLRGFGSLIFNQTIPYPTELEGLHKTAEATLELSPDSKGCYADILIPLKLELGSQLKAIGNLSRMTELYQEAYSLIVDYREGPLSYQYLQRYFLEEDGFKLLDTNSQFVKSWGKYLFQKVLPYTHFPDKQHLYEYRIAQIQPDLIPSETLPTYINCCLKEKNYVLAFELIKRLAETKIDLAVKYICENRAGLHELVTQDTPLLSEAYSKKIIENVGATSARLVHFFSPATKDNEFEQAVLKHPSIEYKDAAPYFLTKYVKENNWEKALSLLLMRRKMDLPIEPLPLDAINSLAQHYTNEGERLYTEGKVLRDENKYDEAEKRYSESLSMMGVAETVLTSSERLYNLNVHRRLLAGIIIDGKSLTLARVNQALFYLEEIDKTSCPKKDEYLNDVYINVLENKVKFLHQSCLLDDFIVKRYATEEHKSSCMASLKALAPTLNKLISLREAYTSVADKGANKKRLAELHFLKAEYLVYFELGNEEHRNKIAFVHYEKACNLEPNQPFYHLCYSKSLPYEKIALIKEENSKGYKLLEQCGLTLLDFNHWFEERWQIAERKVYKIPMPEPIAISAPSFWSSF